MDWELQAINRIALLLRFRLCTTYLGGCLVTCRVTYLLYYFPRRSHVGLYRGLVLRYVRGRRVLFDAILFAG